MPLDATLPGASSRLFPLDIHLLCASVLILRWALNFGFRPEKMPMPIHDFMDSHFGWYAAMKMTDTFHGPLGVRVESIFNGVPRCGLTTNVLLHTNIYNLLPLHAAYSLILLISALSGYIAFFLLAREINGGSRGGWPGVLVALCYAVTPFYPAAPFTPAAIAVGATVLIRTLRGRAGLLDALIMGCIPFFADVAMGEFVLAVGFGAAGAYAAFARRWRAIRDLIVLMIPFGVMVVITDYRLFYEVLIANTFVPHRVEYDQATSGLAVELPRALHRILRGQYHTPVSAYPWFVVLVGAGMVTGGLTRARRIVPLVLLCGVIVLIPTFTALYLSFRGDLPAGNPATALVRSFNLSRLLVLLPLLWCLAAWYSLSMLTAHRALFLLGALCAILYFGSYWTTTSYVDRKDWVMSYEKFMSHELFDDIREAIGRDPSSYRVVNVGMHPSIAQSNGFYTLDGYVAYYPLEYKHRFRRIVIGEIQKSFAVRVYFDRFGSRCYVLSSELGRDFVNTKEEDRRIRDLAIRTRPLYGMGGRYVFSAVEIENHEEIGLRLFDVFEHEKSAFRVRVYEVLKPEAQPTPSPKADA